MTTCNNGHSEVEMVQTDKGLKCPICDDITVYTEDDET